MDQQSFLEVPSEVAVVNQGGLQLHEPGTARCLKTVPSRWSDLAPACLVYEGTYRVEPDEDSQLEIWARYEAAAWVHGAGGKTP